MVKIRLARFGRKNVPSYRVIVIQARDKRNGRPIEYIGSYDPKTQPSTFTIDKDRVKYWLSVGAIPTDTVARLLKKEGLYKIEDKKFNKKPGKKAQERKAKEEEKNTKKAEEKKTVKEPAKEEAKEVRPTKESEQPKEEPKQEDNKKEDQKSTDSEKGTK